jgi:biotin synthase
MITENQAHRLAEAGLYAYNHNLDTSEEYYKEVISTRGFEDRLQTIENVRKTNVTVCSGGIMDGRKYRRQSRNASSTFYFEPTT